MVLVDEIQKCPSLNRSERISQWLQTLPITTEDDQLKWESNMFMMCSDDEDDISSKSDSTYSESECSDSQCSLCLYNNCNNEQTNNSEGPVEDDNVFTLTPENIHEFTSQKRTRMLSSVSVRIQGNLVEKVKWIKMGSDLLINIDTRLFPVHASVLRECSDVFTTMLEKHEGELIVRVEENLSHFKILLEHLYGFRANLSDENVYDILKMSLKYNIATLQQACEKYLQLNTNRLNTQERLNSQEKIINQDKIGVKLQTTINKFAGLFLLR